MSGAESAVLMTKVSCLARAVRNVDFANCATATVCVEFDGKHDIKAPQTGAADSLSCNLRSNTVLLAHTCSTRVVR